MTTPFRNAGAGKASPLESSPGHATGTVDGSMHYADNVVFHARQGHGFAAEKANNLRDRVAGDDVRNVGADNKKDGPDRLVNGVEIQSKYCKTAQDSIDACFHQRGNYRYVDANGKLMQVEVPSNQYADAVKAMERKIEAGKVPGVTDPAAAKDMVRKGHFTYEQAKNIAKFGTVESLTYDAVNGVKLAGTAMGISVAISFSLSILNGKDWREALDNACFEGLCIGGVTWIGSILTAQIGRTGVEQCLRGSTDWLVKQMGSKAAGWIATALRGGDKLSGAAANSYVSKVLRGNIVAGVVATLVLSTDDFLRLFAGKVSKTQVAKNVGKTASGVAGGSAGWVAGKAVGVMLGSAIPIVGTKVSGIIGGLAGSMAGATIATKASGGVLDAYVEDDSKALLDELTSVFASLCDEHLLSEREALRVIAEFKLFALEPMLHAMYASADRKRYVKSLFHPLLAEVLDERPFITLPTDQELIDATAAILARCEKLAAQPPVAPPERRKRDLDEIVRPWAVHLNDDSSVYSGMELYGAATRKKILNAVQAYAHDGSAPRREPMGKPVVLVDFTVGGSASDGIYITTEKIYFKPFLYDPRIFKIREIEHIGLREQECELVIDSVAVKYLSESLTPKMRVIVKCINKYLTQFAAPQPTVDAEREPAIMKINVAISKAVGLGRA